MGLLICLLAFLAAEIVVVIALLRTCRQLRAVIDERNAWLNRAEPIIGAALQWGAAHSGSGQPTADAERALLAALANYEETPHE